MFSTSTESSPIEFPFSSLHSSSMFAMPVDTRSFENLDLRSYALGPLEGLACYVVDDRWVALAVLDPALLPSPASCSLGAESSFRAFPPVI